MLVAQQRRNNSNAEHCQLAQAKQGNQPYQHQQHSNMHRPCNPERRLQPERLRNAVQPNLAVMLKHRWIEEVPDDGDQRGAPIQTTATGRKLLEKLAPAWQRAQLRAKKMLGSSGVDLTFSALKDH